VQEGIQHPQTAASRGSRYPTAPCWRIPAGAMRGGRVTHPDGRAPKRSGADAGRVTMTATRLRTSRQASPRSKGEAAVQSSGSPVQGGITNGRILPPASRYRADFEPHKFPSVVEIAWLIWIFTIMRHRASCSGRP
jgi:hypothetical protein